MSLRRSSLPRHGRRALVASGMAAALVAVPGIALADEPAPGLPVEDPAAVVQQLVDDAQVQVPETGDTETGDTTGGDTTGGDTTGDLGGGGPVFDPADLSILLDGLKQLTGTLGIPDSCVDGIAEGVALILNGLLDPAQLEAILEELTGLLTDFEGTLEELLGGLEGGLGGGLGGVLGGDQEMQLLAAEAEAIEAPEGAPGADVVSGIELIVTTLAEDCIPEGAEPEPEPEVENPQVVHPTPEQPAPPAAQPVAQPVAYPGYAPTGADLARADDTSVPLTALGGGLVLMAAGAAGYGMRGRAVRTRD